MTASASLADNGVAVSYAVRQLLARAGADPDTAPITVSYGGDDDAVGPQVVIRACGPRAWQDLLDRPANSLRWIPQDAAIPRGLGLPFEGEIPVLFSGAPDTDGTPPFAEVRNDGALVFHVDIVAATLFMLTRWEETVVTTRDEHGRFPATASVAYRQGFIDRPVVDEYALILRQWLKAVLPGWQPNSRPFSVKLSHDVDFVRRFHTPQAAILTLGADLLKRHSIRHAWDTGIDAAMQTVAPDRGSYFRGIQVLAELSLDNGLGEDTFYFMAAEPGPLDNDYDPGAPPVARCIEKLQRQGFETGLHASYLSLNDPGRLAREKERMDAILGHTEYGTRQHFLRFEVPHTWQHCENVGFTHDSTMGYADHEGFRCGTCVPFRPFDVGRNRELRLWERPLIVMDQTLRLYRGMTPGAAEARILQLARRCKQVGGTLTLLWHNSSFSGEWGPWAEVYRRVVTALGAMKETRSPECRPLSRRESAPPHERSLAIPPTSAP